MDGPAAIATIFPITADVSTAAVSEDAMMRTYIDRRRRRVDTIEEMVTEIHVQSQEAIESDWAFMQGGYYLLFANESKLAADWWKWYEKHFSRSRKDAEKVMVLASSDDP